MNRKTSLRLALALVGLLIFSGSATAQMAHLGDGTPIYVSAPQAEMLSSFPQAWRDSVSAGWARSFTGAAYRPELKITRMVAATVKLQLLRNGDLRRARISASSGDAHLDSFILSTSWEADRALGYPKFPVGVEGAGTEIELLVRIGSEPPSRTASGAPIILGSSHYDVPPLSPRCDSLLAAPNGSTSMTLRLAVDSTSGDGGGVDWAMRVLTSLQTEFRAPGRLTPAWRPKIWMDNSRTQPPRIGLQGTLHLTTDSIGKVLEAAMLISTGVPALDSALVAMVWSADSAGAIPPPMGSTTASIDAAIATDRGQTHLGTPLGVITLATWSLDAPPKVLRPAMPHYPEAAKRSGIQGRVEMAFVVGTDGRVIPESIQVISTPHALLTEAAAQAVLGTIFGPGMAGSCPVPVLVRQRVNFSQ